MMRLYFSFFILSLFTIISGYSKNTRIHGVSVEYKNKELVVYTYSDPVLMDKNILATSLVQERGNFNLTFDLHETSEVYIDLGKYKGILVTEPGKEYDIKLPPFEEVSERESRSPYFKQKPYWIGLNDKNEDELNYCLRSFIKDYHLKINDNVSDIYKNSSKIAAEAIISDLDKKYPDSGNKFFNSVKMYHFAELEYLVNKNNLDEVINKYFSGKPVQIQNPKYREVFRIIFTNFLSNKANSINGEEIYSLVNNGRFSQLVNFFIKDGYNRDFAEFAVLKGLYDAYYSKDFIKEGVLEAINNAGSEASTEETKLLSSKITKKLNHMVSGTHAPQFSLRDANGKETTLESFHGKYIYLNFIYTDSHDCQNELKLLKNVHQRYGEVLDVVTVSLDKDFNTSKNYWKDNKMEWVLLNGSDNNSIVNDYSVRSAPSFFLIAPDGILLLSPSPSVSEGFETVFVRAFRNYENKRKYK